MNKITYICFVFLLSIYNITEAQIQRVRIDFESPLGFVRPLLLGFDPNNVATDGVDLGWDALNADNFPDELDWLIANELGIINHYVIQGVGAFDETKKYPFGLLLTNSGNITISLNSLENFDPPINVYIYDSEYDTYTQINNTSFTANMPSGEYLDKYYIAFLEPSLSLNENNLQEEAEIKYLSNTKELYINTNNSYIKQVSLHSLLGQEVFSLKDINSNKLRILLDFIKTDFNIVTIITDNGSVSKKIIIH